MVEQVVNKLESEGVLNNTYIIYTADNGYHLGQHRLSPGKKCAFEEDINVPLIIRGPKIAKSKSTDLVTAQVDLAPTIFNMIGKDLRSEFDGAGLKLPLLTDQDFAAAKSERGEHVNVEFWGNWTQEGRHPQIGRASCRERV